MSALEVRKLKASTKLCETCLVEPGPSRMGRYQVFLLGRPADFVCAVHKKAWERLFERFEEAAA